MCNRQWHQWSPVAVKSIMHTPDTHLPAASMRWTHHQGQMLPGQNKQLPHCQGESEERVSRKQYCVVISTTLIISSLREGNILSVSCFWGVILTLLASVALISSRDNFYCHSDRHRTSAQSNESTLQSAHKFLTQIMSETFSFTGLHLQLWPKF